MRKFPYILAALMLAANLSIVGTASAQSAPYAQNVIVDGNHWLSSTPDMRKAFLIGAGNMVALEMAYAKKKGTPQPPAGTMTKDALQGMTLDQLSSHITRWYEAHPDRRDMPVMGVIWTDLVKPTAKTK